MCRKAYAALLGIGQATLTRQITTVHQSSGRFAPSAHKNEGQDGHHQLPSHVQDLVINFLEKIAESVGEESSGRHSRRNEHPVDNSPAVPTETPVGFLPAMYSLRLLHHLYNDEIKRKKLPSNYRVLWNSFLRIFHSPKLSWLKIRSPRDDVCDICLLYRQQMVELLKQPETFEANVFEKNFCLETNIR